ncbi:MAG: hydroxymethylbilane synthase [Vampirovibrionales bacterium]|nr:hydroxymethylbilane synthase [Vampirovibrionales bacterium]
MTINNIRLGTRHSALAQAQAHRVGAMLQTAWPMLALETKTMTTVGDRNLEASFRELVSQGHAGVFVKELETSLLSRDIDLAVHSLKDMPSVQPQGLMMIPVGLRDDPRDALILNPDSFPDTASLLSLPSGSRIGTASARRAALVSAVRKDLICLPVRGNLQTRLRKLSEGHFDGLLLAKAGFDRLPELSSQWRVVPCCPYHELMPAPAQGMLAVEFLENRDKVFSEMLAPLLPPLKTQLCIAAERAVLTGLSAGCHVALAVYAEFASEDAESGTLNAVIHDNSTDKLYRVSQCFEPSFEATLDAARAIVAQLKPYAPSA